MWTKKEFAMAKLVEIEGIGAKFSKLLQSIGIEDQYQLLHTCSERGGRERVARETGISGKLILKWTNQADLARINGIGEEYAELLERSGVDTVPELAQRNAESLVSMLQETNDRLNLVRHLPGLPQVQSWIEQAKNLPRMIYY
jgi:predicted flap endonuclease-1-like 5' DNA nuclease